MPDDVTAQRGASCLPDFAVRGKRGSAGSSRISRSQSDGNLGAVLGVDFVPGMKAAWREPGRRLSASLRVEAAAASTLYSTTRGFHVTSFPHGNL